MKPLTYHVTVSDVGIWRVLCLDIEDATFNGVYRTYKDLPQIMQERIAVLNVVREPYPDKDIEGVGRRFKDRTYWVYIPQ